MQSERTLNFFMEYGIYKTSGGDKSNTKVGLGTQSFIGFSTYHYVKYTCRTIDTCKFYVLTFVKHDDVI